MTQVQVQQQSLSQSSIYARYALAGGICASGTHLILVPLDVVKTRIQVQPTAYSGTFATFSKIIKHEGYGALALGLGPTTFGYLLQGACKFGIYEYTKKAIAQSLGDEVASKNKTAMYMVSAALAEVVGSTVLRPWEALRIRCVAQPEVYKHNMAKNFVHLAQSEGIIGLYRGLGPILMKQVPYTVVQLAVFQHAVNAAYSHVIPRVTNYRSKEEMSTRAQLAVSVLAGTVAGVTSAIVSHPADTVLSKVNSTKGKTVSSTIKDLGMRGLWHGVGPRCLMVGALSAGMFLIYDSVKVLCGLPTSS